MIYLPIYWVMHLERPKLKGGLKLLVLYLLRESPMHGYAIMKELEERFGIPSPSAGVIYPTLAGLRRSGLIEVVGGGKREKKTYRITEKGVEYLEQHRDELEETLRRMRIYREFRNLGGGELVKAFRLLFERFDELSEKQKEELSKIMKDCARKVRFTVEFGGD